MPPDNEKPVDRRRFFRLGFAELLGPLSALAKPLQHAAEQIAKLDHIRQPHAQTVAPSQIASLRPPGSLPDLKFRETCSRCGNCVRACPANAIQIDATGRRGNGAPFIDPDAMSCVVCEGLQCMHVCPSGALVPTSINDIDMGTAVWREDSCLRTTGDSCTICIDHCPLGSAAIELKNNEVAVNPHGCIGCGVCQHDCPTTPKSIYVIPIAAKHVG
jgi:ferredoxin-type protein NapG